jgi:hypothetical protein
LDYDDAVDVCVQSDDERQVWLLIDATWRDLGIGTQWFLPKLDAWNTAVIKMTKI